jgi:opacity protein-like surface antigen
MKKQAIILAALIGAASAQAQSSEPFYVTVAGGSTHVNLDCTGASSCDTSDTGGKLVGGYRLGKGFSVELGYVGFGKFRASDSTLAVTLKPTAILLGGAYALPLNGDWGMNLRLGVAQVKTKADVTSSSVSGSASESKAKVYAGVGATYAVSPTVKLELGVDSTNAEIVGQKGAVRLISLGATFAF